MSLPPVSPPAFAAALDARFGTDMGADGSALDAAGQAGLFRLLDRRACRRFEPRAVPEGLLRLVIAAGLAAPSKSDLQQADILWLQDPALRAAALAGCGDWAEALPPEAALLVVCGDGRRLRRLYGPDWENDHFDALFNAAGDAAILLANLVASAALAGLGACPISVMRNRGAALTDLLALPERVFPFAGLAIGWPAEPRAPVSPRLGPDGALHIDRFDAAGQDRAVAAYDARRGPVRGAPSWSEAKREQYSAAQRSDWGALLRAQGFSME